MLFGFWTEWNTLCDSVYPDLIEVRSHGKLLIWVCEAKNPCPDLTFLCANITSLRTRWPSIQDHWQADVYFWQEVRLGLDGQNIMAAQLREHGLHAQWSAPQPTVRPKAAPGRRRPRVTPWSVKQGGAAVAARQEIPLYTDNARDALRRELWETQRWAAAALPFRDRKQYLHVRSAYAEAGASTDDRLLEHSEIFVQIFLQKLQASVISPLYLVWMPTSRGRGLLLSTLCSPHLGGLMWLMKLQVIVTSSRRRTTKMVCSLARSLLLNGILGARCRWTCTSSVVYIVQCPPQHHLPR